MQPRQWRMVRPILGFIKTGNWENCKPVPVQGSTNFVDKQFSLRYGKLTMVEHTDAETGEDKTQVSPTDTSFAEVCERAHAICDRYGYKSGSKYIGHLGRQDSEYDNTLAEFAEFIPAAQGQFGVWLEKLLGR